MKYRYDKEDDALMIWFSHKAVDFAEQTGDVIMHFSKEGRPVLMEILKASVFLKQSAQALPRSLRSAIAS